jgi:hypothetical protein
MEGLLERAEEGHEEGPSKFNNFIAARVMRCGVVCRCDIGRVTGVDTGVTVSAVALLSRRVADGPTR